jgi:OOP family OmpA-OmpF porin
MKKIILINIISIITLNAFGQFSDSPKALADKAFKNKDYYEAAYYYKEAANGLVINPQVAIPFRSDNKPATKVESTDRDYVSYQLADSYRLYENYIEAEGWYFKVVDDGATAKFPLARLWYGVCLRANQHFDEALKQLELFNKEYKGDDRYYDIANKELLNCRFAKEEYQYPSLIAVVKMNGKAISDGSDYAIDINNGKRYFTSSRIMKDDKKHLNRIYIMGDSPSDKPELVKIKNTDNKKDVEYGTPAIDKTGTRMYFTRWYKEGSKTTHAIYISNLTNDEWGTPVKLNANVNAEGFNAIQPFITTDGKRLFFVSNKPGGQGGDDIWVADLGADGNPINSTNLGSTINTPLDEEAPYYDVVEKKLIYSSKGFVGLGGFDFFESFEDIGGQWSKPKNMGYPMNSAKDDLYYLPDNNNPKKSYISSDRESDCCLDLFEVYDKKYVFSGRVTDCDANTPLQGVTVSFVDSISKQTIHQAETGVKGTYTFNVPNKRPFSMRLEKKGYFTKNLPVPDDGRMKGDTLINPDICLQAFVVNKPIVIKNILYDFNKATLRPESMTMLDVLVKIMVDNPKIRVELSAHTDSIGSDAYNLKLSQDRAQSCVDYMIGKGVSNERIFAKGYGKSRPIAPNSLPNGKDNPDGRQLNRRTEFTVLKTE